TAIQDSGRNSIFDRGILGIRCLKRASEKWAFIFATTGISPKAGERWGWRARRLFSIRRRRWPGFRNICGSWSSPRRRRTIYIMWERSIGLGLRSRGALANFMDRLISLTRAGKSWPRGNGVRTALLWRILIWI